MEHQSINLRPWTSESAKHSSSAERSAKAEGLRLPNDRNQCGPLEIVVHGDRKYTGKIDRTRYERLVDLDRLTRYLTNARDVEYVATDLGRTAATL